MIYGFVRVESIGHNNLNQVKGIGIAKYNLDLEQLKNPSRDKGPVVK